MFQAIAYLSSAIKLGNQVKQETRKTENFRVFTFYFF
jgi:hypothetical protein